MATHDRRFASLVGPDRQHGRFHGPAGDYRGSYDSAYLHDTAKDIKKWTAEGKTVFAYFNNTMGEAFNNLTFLNTLIYDKQL